MAGLNPDKLKKAANVGRAISQPTAEGAKDTAAEVAKGAIKGAATGGAVGAARGAAVAFAKTKAGRTLIAIALAVVLVTVMALPIGIVTIIAATSASASHGDEYRSGESVVASGKEKEEVSEAIALGNRYGIKWQLVLAVRTVEGDNADLDKLRGVLSRGPSAPSVWPPCTCRARAWCRCPPWLMRCFPLVIPEPVGTGLMPASFANAASLRMRSGLSPATMRISAAVSTPIPNSSSR